MGIDQRAPKGTDAVAAIRTGQRIERRTTCGGLINEYHPQPDLPCGQRTTTEDQLQRATTLTGIDAEVPTSSRHLQGEPTRTRHAVTGQPRPSTNRARVKAPEPVSRRLIPRNPGEARDFGRRVGARA